MDENQLEQMLSKIKHEPLDEALLSNLSETEKPALLLAAELKSIPVLNAPQAAPRRQYAAQTSPSPVGIFSLFNFRQALSLAVILLIVLGGGLTYATAQSLPGQKLFSIKKTAEQFRVKFASSKIQRAYLQVQIAKKRMAEAQTVASAQNKNPQAELAAIRELSQATELAAKEVQTLSPKAIKESKEPLLSSLEDVGQKEQNLVSSLAAGKEGQSGKEDVIALSLANQTRVSAIKQAVAVATAEEAITNLSADPSEVLVSGQITQIDKNSVTVEKTIFTLDEKTLVVSPDGKKLDPSELKLESKVAAAGKKSDKQLKAVKLTVLESARPNADSANKESAEAKGENAQADKLNSTTPPSILKPKVEAENPAEPPIDNTNQATGSFIIETPLPQYAP